MQSLESYHLDQCCQAIVSSVQSRAHSSCRRKDRDNSHKRKVNPQEKWCEHNPLIMARISWIRLKKRQSHSLWNARKDLNQLRPLIIGNHQRALERREILRKIKRLQSDNSLHLQIRHFGYQKHDFDARNDRVWKQKEDEEGVWGDQQDFEVCFEYLPKWQGILEDHHF